VLLVPICACVVSVCPCVYAVFAHSLYMFGCRFPVITWRHPVTKAVLLRSSGFHSKGVIGVFKGHYSSPVTSKSCNTNSLFCNHIPVV